jgi:hypothetical protein
MDQRKVRETDIPLLTEWISRDPYHRDTTTADFFFEAGTVCNVYSDHRGPVLFMRGQPMLVGPRGKVIRLDIQFDNEQTLRNGRMLIIVNKIFCEQAKKAGFKELFFTSDFPTLKAFCVRALGFSEKNGTLSKSL